MRVAFAKFDNMAMLWSIGKDSTALLWLARKAFFGHVPFPLVHIDTSYKIPSMIEYRDRLVREWNLQLVVGRAHMVHLAVFRVVFYQCLSGLADVCPKNASWENRCVMTAEMGVGLFARHDQEITI